MTKTEVHPVVQAWTEERAARRRLTSADRKDFATLDTIARDAERRDMSVSKAISKRAGTVLQLDLHGRKYELSLREMSSGRAIWMLGPGLSWSGLRYFETVRIPLEARLPKMFADIQEAQPVQDEQEARWRERDLRWEREKAERAERSRRAKQEEARVSQLLDVHARWTQARDLRIYVDSLETRVNGMEADARLRADEWLGWVREFIEKIGPVNDDLRLPTDLPTI